jgi:hypothetical protein
MVDYRKISFRQQDIFIRREIVRPVKLRIEDILFIRREIVRAVTLRIEESFDEVDPL